MVEFEHSIFVESSPQSVFDYATNPANDAEWQGSIESSEWVTDGPAGVGSEMKSIVKFMGREFESTAQITEWEPPSRFGMKVDQGPVPFELSVRVESEQSGSRVTLHGQAEVGSFFKLAEGLVGKQLQKQFETDLKTLKSKLES